MRVVVISPHPDDAELFAGGTIAKHVHDGDEVTEILVTRGELGAVFRRNVAALRESEAREGARILGIGKLKILGLKDRSVDLKHGEILLPAIEEEDPDLVYAPDPRFTFYSHPDHVAVGRMVDGAFERIRFYHTTRPNLEVDVRDFMEIKRSAIGAHRSQRYVLILCLEFSLILRLRRMMKKGMEAFRENADGLG